MTTRYEVRESGKSFAIFDTETQSEVAWGSSEICEIGAKKRNNELAKSVAVAPASQAEETARLRRDRRDEMNTALRHGGYRWQKLNAHELDEREMADMVRSGMPAGMIDAFDRAQSRPQWELRDEAGNIVDLDTALRECAKTDYRAKKFI